ncbi:hypothetical protein Acsp04_66110 [Actinomadura sp. NBRC 104425]|uniref:hypothetical protein n=1 Tax=Actinomadura sp. NBRC 104425 TaxID=3032204 RepID=UPI0024A2F025|nr:hypothetical protein [Actinomadura sp. NBRC 104425]GLZ16376.1 hypothetical protein Acsp04_66110 [Actinomadura sp. NBRC 104425]
MTRYYRRGHWVNMPSRRGTKGGSGWLIAGAVALLLYLLSSAGGDGQTGRQPSSHASTTPAATRTP